MAKESKLKDGNHYARVFKLHHCIGSESFARQVARIQSDAIADFVITNGEKEKLNCKFNKK